MRDKQVCLYLPSNNYREAEYEVVFHGEDNKYAIYSKEPLSDWLHIKTFPTLEEAIFECLLVESGTPDEILHHHELLRIISEKGSGIYHGPFGAVTKTDIESLGYRTTDLSDETMSLIANELGGDALSFVYWECLKGICHDFDLERLTKEERKQLGIPEEDEDED